MERWRKEEKRRLDKGQKKRGRGNKQEKRRANMRGGKASQEPGEKMGELWKGEEGEESSEMSELFSSVPSSPGTLILFHAC